MEHSNCLKLYCSIRVLAAAFIRTHIPHLSVKFRATASDAQNLRYLSYASGQSTRLLGGQQETLRPHSCALMFLLTTVQLPCSLSHCAGDKAREQPVQLARPTIDKDNKFGNPWEGWQVEIILTTPTSPKDHTGT